MLDHTPGRTLTPGRGSRNESTRRHNLSTVLSLVHHGRGMSRADLTRATGLNRSTIGLLVADLVGAGLVSERAPEASGVGRPSPVVVPNPDVVAIAVSPDVDAVVLGVVGLGGVVHARRRVEFASVPTAAEVVSAVTEHARALVGAPGVPERRVVGAGVAVPGLVRVRTGVVARAPHLRWQDEDLARPLAAALGVAVAVDNDANAALVAETLFGATRGRSSVVYLNGSVSGIGGSLLTDGAILRGADGFAGELGHTIIRADGERCHCGRRGCLETEVNLQRLEAAATEAIDHDDVEASLRAQDSGALAEEIDRQVDVLGRAMASFVSAFNPQAVVLGGYLSALHALRTARLTDTLQDMAFSPLADSVEVLPAQLGDELLMVGAAELGFEELLADPGSAA
ncbi:ROK family transcriptional regulator [Demequina sp. NBRC 110056]|uniref:ROK family transcriptional regulator n=1 Tax=Demequina sp. NBRC 110056 TaxID=1570345 RepID=UPI000A009CE1|nr:ROK family transcriptional regulator [Demequina sp. NBRC 110056]